MKSKLDEKVITLHTSNEEYYRKYQNYSYSSTLTHSDIGKLMLLVNSIDDKNEIKVNDNYPSINTLMTIMRITNRNTLSKSLSKLQSNNVIYIKEKRGYKIILINPVYFQHCNFEWNKYVFDIFEDSTKGNYKDLEYLKIKSNWYNVNNKISIKTYSEVLTKISGVYRLYKDDKIVYIGKAKCIRSRINSHSKDKDFDEFDFTIIHNNSNKNLYELYYIDLYKPILNIDCIEDSNSDIKLEELTFTNKIKMRDITYE